MSAIRSVFAAAVNLLETEPVVVVGLITSLIDAAVVFGVPIDESQKTALIGIITALGVLLARSKATSVTTPTLASGTAVTVVTPAGQPNTTTVV